MELQNIYLAKCCNYRGYSESNEGMRWVKPFLSSTTNFSWSISGATEKQLRKATINLAMSVRTAQRNYHRTNIRAISCLGFLLKLVFGLYNWNKLCPLWGTRWQSNVTRTSNQDSKSAGVSTIPIIVQSSISHTFLLANPFWLQKITTGPHILAHVNTECPDDRQPKLKICISELTLDRQATNTDQ
jgi:hypothetical protein